MADYYDVKAIIAEETLIPTKLKHGASLLGRGLDPGSSERDAPAGVSIDMPLWMAHPLVKRHMADIRAPAVYSERYRRKLNAGAECMSFRSKAPYFYEVGHRINEHLQDADLSTLLATTFRSRYVELISKGLNVMTGEEVLQLNSKLSMEEAALFEVGRASVGDTERWMRGLRRQAAMPANMTARLKRASAAQPAGGAEKARR